MFLKWVGNHFNKVSQCSPVPEHSEVASKTQCRTAKMCLNYTPGQWGKWELPADGSLPTTELTHTPFRRVE